jgi:hypothetical protein
LTLISCFKNEFPDEKLLFSDKYLNLLRPYEIGDSLIFKNSEGQVEAFIITGKDSIISNTIGWFIKSRSYKSVSLSYNQFPSKQWTHEFIKRDANNKAIKTTYKDDVLIFLNIYPDTGEEDCHIPFKNFRGWIRKGKDTIFNKSITANQLKINQYYKVENIATDLVRNPSDVKTVYIKVDKGIIAYQDQEQRWWTRTN